MEVRKTEKAEQPKAKKDQPFADAIKASLGGRTITSCYQCGTCASSCPVTRLDPRFNPREIIKLSILGEKKEVLEAETIWLCCSCYNCQERCPQKVEIADVIYALRNIAIKGGKIPGIYQQFLSAISNDGRIVKVSKFAENKRATIGLPPLTSTNVGAIRKILSATGLDKFTQEGEATQ